MHEQLQASQRIKDGQILIITGNPPYSGASENKGLFENEVKISYGLEPSLAFLNEAEKSEVNLYLKALQGKDEKMIKDKKSTFNAIYERKKLQNESLIKWLFDDYVKFIRFAEQKIETQKQGIIAIISNNGFLDNPTFRGMRYHLLKTFDKIYILDLHGSTRKKEFAPDGSKDENVFDIQQGVCISVFVKTGQKNSQDLARIYHSELFGKRREKYNFLKENDLNSVEWKEFSTQAPYYLFRYYDKKVLKEWLKNLSIDKIFELSSTGICSQRDSIVIHNSKQSIKQLINDFCNLSKEENVKKYHIEKDGRDWQIQTAIDSVKNSQKDKSGAITQILCNPFDFRWTYYDGKGKGFMAYPRTEVMQNFINNENIGLVCDRGCDFQDIDNFFVTQSITDLHLIGGGSYIFPLYRYEKNSQKTNFTEEFCKFIDKKYKQKFSPEQILGYIYAVLYHKEYREKYAVFLRIDYPHIPFCESDKKFLKLSELGGELINLHLMKAVLKKDSIGEYEHKDSKNQNFKIEKIAYYESTQELFVNESLYFMGVENAVWEYKIGGYAVLDKYLKSHKNEIIDYEHFEKIIKTLHKSLEIEKQIAKIELV